MGNYKFRLSEIIPNSWFNKTKKHKKKLHDNLTKSSPSSSSSSRQLPSTATTHSHHRKSYYFNRDLNFIPPKPRKSSNKLNNTKTISTRMNMTAPPSARSYLNFNTPPLSTPCGVRTTNPIRPEKLDENQLDTTILTTKLPQIITRTGENREKSSKEQRNKPVRRNSGLKLKTNSPRIGAGKRIHQERKSTALQQSFVVVKRSEDPKRDFMESMVEMIVENNIRGSKDLEDLLACYLSLNSDEYHDLIIKVFRQIWFDVVLNVRLN